MQPKVQKTNGLAAMNARIRKAHVSTRWRTSNKPGYPNAAQAAASQRFASRAK